MKEKNYVIILTDEKQKHLGNPVPFQDKSTQQIRNRQELPQPNNITASTRNP